MTLTHILVFVAMALPFMWLVPIRWRPWGLMVGSVLALGWLQWSSDYNELTFVLPAATVILTVLVWWVVRPPATSAERQQDNVLALVLIGGALFVVWLTLGLNDGRVAVVPALAGLMVVGVSAVSLRQVVSDVRPTLGPVLIIGIVLVLAVLKVPRLAVFAGEIIGDAPLVWLGFSYVAFRLIAVLLDHGKGRLPKEGLALRDMATYVLFFPAYTAGPIDRAQHFVPELNKTHGLDAARLVDGGTRIAVGVFKKFVVADTLARVAMSTTLIERTEGMSGLWLLLYLYAFQIFFDFSGYSDVAIGIGKLYGIDLPENFDRPYLQPNLQQFWQRWHMTLATWFRIYYFTPVSRFFMKRKVSQYLNILVAQVTTMVLIGLWHGVTLNFVLWGLWHGVGLFALKYMVDHTRGWYKAVTARSWSRRLMVTGGVFATFHYVTLGWVFFALPEVSDSLDMLQRLFGG